MKKRYNEMEVTREMDGTNERMALSAREALKGKYSSVPVLALWETDSTNLRLKEWAREGKITPPYFLLADCQTAGRGRLGRAFVSPPGTGLYMSLLIDPPRETKSGSVTILAAVAVCRAIEELTGLKPKIKWVNDLFLRGKKVCGILAEKINEGVIVGIGINVESPPGGFPPEAGIAGALEKQVDHGLLGGWAARYILEGMENPDDPAILHDYRVRMPLIGKTVRYTQQGIEKNALVTGVSDDGGLLVETEGRETILHSGEVTLGSQSFLGLE